MKDTTADARESNLLRLDNCILSRAGSVATITMNRPERLNALGHEPGGMHDDLQHCFALVDADTSVRCVILRGEGGVFSSGGDLRKGAPVRETPIDFYRFQAREHARNQAVRDMSKPVIAAIEGTCYGAGLILAAHCDFRVASEGARFGLIESRMGNGGAEVFPYLIGVQWAKFLILTSEIIDAERALKIGLVLDVIPPHSFMTKVNNLAERIAALPPSGVFMNKLTINAAEDMMGYQTNMLTGRANNAIADMMARESTSSDGRRLRDILAAEGFSAFKEARDRAFNEPWLA